MPRIQLPIKNEAATTMAAVPPSASPISGFCNETAVFYTLRPPLSLPPLDQPFSVTSFSFSLLFSSHTGSLPNHPAYIEAATGAAISYSAAADNVRSIAISLLPLLSKGDVAFVLSPATVQVPLLYMALFSVGAVVCPSNPACTPSEISPQCLLVKPNIAFATSSTASLLPASGRGAPNLVILLDSPQFPSFPRSGEDREPQQLPIVDLVEVRQSDPAMILFSSGTTGMPKAVLVSHRSYVTMIAGLADGRRMGFLPKDGPLLLGAPMFHTMGVVASLRGVALGETTIIVDRPGLRGLLEVAERFGARSMVAAPPVVVWMTEMAARCPAALQHIVCGGAALQPAAAERFRRKFPWVDIIQGYGMTEGGMIATLVTMKECLNYKSVGKLTSFLNARIVDLDTDKPLGVGMLGELRLKGSSLMIEYVGDVEATCAIFDSEGWLKTGDLCYFDEEGYLYIVSRLKDLIKYKGYQVPPLELEQLLVSHEEIADAAVVPYPDEIAGEIPMAFVVRQPGSTISESQIIDFIAKQVAPYKKIRKVSFIGSIPKDPSGKTRRKELAHPLISSRISKL